MVLSDNDIIDSIEKSEGWPKFTDHPDDKGGPTKGGITLATLEHWRQRPCEKADLKALDRHEARQIYQQMYIDDPGFRFITESLLRYQVVDCGVLHGPRRASKWLQQAINAQSKAVFNGQTVKVDGRFGPASQALLTQLRHHSDRINLRIATCRIRFLGRIVGRDPSQARWINGWLNRATKFVTMQADGQRRKA